MHRISLRIDLIDLTSFFVSCLLNNFIRFKREMPIKNGGMQKSMELSIINVFLEGIMFLSEPGFSRLCIRIRLE